MAAVEKLDDRERIWRPDLASQVNLMYDDAAGVVERLLAVARRRNIERSEELRALDDARLSNPQWFQRPQMLGCAAYADRFAGDLRAVAEHSDCLAGWSGPRPLLGEGRAQRRPANLGDVGVAGGARVPGPRGGVEVWDPRDPHVLLVDRLSGLPPQMREGDALLPPYAAAWLTARDPDAGSAASAQRAQAVQTVQG